MPEIIFPISGSAFRMACFIRMYNLLLNYFPNEPFFLLSGISQWGLKTSQEHVISRMVCFSFPMTYPGLPMFLLPKVILVSDFYLLS